MGNITDMSEMLLAILVQRAGGNVVIERDEAASLPVGWRQSLQVQLQGSLVVINSQMLRKQPTRAGQRRTNRVMTA